MTKPRRPSCGSSSVFSKPRRSTEKARDGPHRSTLYREVPDLGRIRKALAGWPEVVPERTTFHGAREIIVRDPDGNVVFFAKHG